MEKTRKQLPAYLILGIIALVAAVVLAATNMITKGPIAEQAAAELQAALNTVLPAAEYVAMEPDASYKVTGLYEAKAADGATLGWCVTAKAAGYGGDVAVTLGVGADGVVTGIVVGDINFAETSGYGMRAKEPEFQAQFPGIDAVNGGSFDALSGATVTSNAVRKAVNQGLRCVVEVGMGRTALENVVSFTAE